MKITKEEKMINTKYEDIQKDIRDLVAAVSDIIKSHDKLKDKNFGLFYQHGRLGYVDLDMFAKTVDMNSILKAKKETEDKKELDKEKKE